MNPRWMPALLVLALGTPAFASEKFTASKDFDAGDATGVRVRFPAGSLQIARSPDRRVHATMTARCKWGDCSDRVEKMRLVSDQHGDRLDIKLEGLNHHSSWLEVTLRLEIPRELDVDVDMGAGDLDVRGTEQDVNVELGAGDIDIRVPEQAVRSVVLDVGVGDATMRASRGRVRPSGWLGKHLDWDEGEGAARVRVHLGVGDASVMLD